MPALLEANGVNLTDDAAFATDVAALFGDWTDQSSEGFPSAGLALRVATLLANWNANQVQFRAWWVGEPDGGWTQDGVTPGGGYYPLTDGLGNIRYLPSPAKMLSDLARGYSALEVLVDAGILPGGTTEAQFADWLRAPAVDAVASLQAGWQTAYDAAVIAADTAEDALALANAAQDAADAALVLAQETVDDAEAAALQATGAADAAAASLAAIGTAEADTEAARDEAVLARNAAVASADGAALSEFNAAGSAGAAASSATEASADAAAADLDRIAAEAAAAAALASEQDAEAAAIAADASALAALNSANDAAAEAIASAASAAAALASETAADASELGAQSSEDDAEAALALALAAQAAAEAARDDAEAAAGLVDAPLIEARLDALEDRQVGFEIVVDPAIAGGNAIGLPIPGLTLDRLLVFVNYLADKSGSVLVGQTLTVQAEAGDVIAVVLPGGVQGRDGADRIVDASGLKADRGTYDAEAAGFVYQANDTLEASAKLTAVPGDWGPWIALTAGPPGADGNDAAVTAGNIATALGYTPADEADVPALSDATPATLRREATGAPGASADAARADHAHIFPLSSGRELLAAGPLVAADHGSVVEWNAENGALTLPSDLFDGFNCLVRVSHATGVPTFTAAAGATIRQADGLTTARKRWSEVSIAVRSNVGGAAAEYVLSGDMA